MTSGYLSAVHLEALIERAYRLMLADPQHAHVHGRLFTALIAERNRRRTPEEVRELERARGLRA